jgi:hypothetical protein
VKQKSPKNYRHKIVSSHSFICGTTLCLDLCITRMNSFSNEALHLCTDGSISLNSQALLSDQIHQLIKIMISIAKGTRSLLLKYLVALSALSQVGTVIPICPQQFLTKEHLKNKCLSFSSFCKRHNSHVYDSKCMFFLLSKLGVILLPDALGANQWYDYKPFLKRRNWSPKYMTMCMLLQLLDRIE